MILGYPWWLSVPVVVVFAALLWHVFDGWVRPLVRVPLVIVLAPACLLVAVVVAAALSAALSGPYEPPEAATGTDERRLHHDASPFDSPRDYRGADGVTDGAPSPSPSPSPSASPGP